MQGPSVLSGPELQGDFHHLFHYSLYTKEFWLSSKRIRAHISINIWTVANKGQKLHLNVLNVEVLSVGQWT